MRLLCVTALATLLAVALGQTLHPPPTPRSSSAPSGSGSAPSGSGSVHSGSGSVHSGSGSVHSGSGSVHSGSGSVHSGSGSIHSGSGSVHHSGSGSFPSGSGSFPSSSGSFPSASGSKPSGSGSFPSASGSQQGSNAGETIVDIKHRQLRHPQINVTADGYIIFCPAGHDWSSTEAFADNCTSIRPAAFYEADSDGRLTLVSENSKDRRILLNLHEGLLVSAPALQYFPRCPAKPPAAAMCGAASDGSRLSYNVVPLTIDLTSIAEGMLILDALSFVNGGWFLFDGKNFSVKEGTSKFDISMAGYSFASNGTTVYLEIEVGFPSSPTIKNNNSLSNNTGSNNTLANNTLAASRRVVGVPRYAVSNGSLMLTPEWKNVTIELSKEAPVIRYTFQGPFRNLAYDPFVRTGPE